MASALPLHLHGEPGIEKARDGHYQERLRYCQTSLLRHPPATCPSDAPLDITVAQSHRLYLMLTEALLEHPTAQVVLGDGRCGRGH